MMSEHEQSKAALAWMRAQAKALAPGISNSESVFYCARIISANLLTSRFTLTGKARRLLETLINRVRFSGK